MKARLPYLWGNKSTHRARLAKIALDAIPDGVDDAQLMDSGRGCGLLCRCGDHDAGDLISVEQSRLYVPIAELAAA